MYCQKGYRTISTHIGVVIVVVLVVVLVVVVVVVVLYLTHSQSKII